MAAKSADQFSDVTVTIHIPRDDIRAFRDPNGLGRKWYMCQVPIEEIEKAQITFGPNPRNQSTGTKVFEGIHTTLIEKPEWFLYYSKGIVVNAQEASYDNKTETLVIRLRRNESEPWSSPGGNADGGHLQRAILDAFENGELAATAREQAYVKLEVLTGIPTGELDDLVGARNTNLQVNELSLAVLGNKLDWLREILKKHEVDDQIAWRQFEEGKILPGQDVVASLSLVNPELTERERIRCYNGPGRLITELRHNEKLMKGLESCKSIAFEWLVFVDYLHASFEKWYLALKGDADSRFGNLKGVTCRTHYLVFLRKEIRYSVSKAWLMPLAGAFAPHAHTQSPREWRAVADSLGPTLLERIWEMTNAESNNLTAFGKRGFAWGNLASEVKTAFMERRLARASA